MFIDFKIYLAPITTYLTSLDYFCVDSVPTFEKVSNLVSHFKETTKWLPKVSILLMLILHCSSNTKFFNLLKMSNVLVLTLWVFISNFSWFPSDLQGIDCNTSMRQSRQAITSNSSGKLNLSISRCKLF